MKAVDSLAADQQIVAELAEHLVVLDLPEEAVGAVSRLDRVTTRSAEHGVIA